MGEVNGEKNDGSTWTGFWVPSRSTFYSVPETSISDMMMDYDERLTMTLEACNLSSS